MTVVKPRTGPAQLACLIAHEAIDVVLDVGANCGQYACMLRREGYDGPILSFEPQPEVHAALVSEAATDPLWRVAAPLALGNHAGRVLIEVAAESDMSSILPQTDLLRAVSPSSAVIDRVEVEIARLDSLVHLCDPAWRRMLLKIDVQGYEGFVLDGAVGLLPRIRAVQLEMALRPVYEGESGWRSVCDRMEALGFDLHLVLPGYFERKLGRMLQIDGVFVRRDPGDAVPASLDTGGASCPPIRRKGD